MESGPIWSSEAPHLDFPEIIKGCATLGPNRSEQVGTGRAGKLIVESLNTLNGGDMAKPEVQSPETKSKVKVENEEEEEINACIHYILGDK